MVEGGIEAEMLLIRNALPGDDVVQRVEERLSLLGVCLCANLDPSAGERSARREEAPAVKEGEQEEEDKAADEMPEEILVPVGQMHGARAGEQEDAEAGASRGEGGDAQEGGGAQEVRLQAARTSRASMDLSMDLWLPALERRRLLILSCQVPAE